MAAGLTEPARVQPSARAKAALDEWVRRQGGVDAIKRRIVLSGLLAAPELDDTDARSGSRP